MSAAAPSPTTEQEARAKWDLLLQDLEYRAEQLRSIRQDQDFRRQQMTGIRQDIAFKPWQIAFAGMTSGAALLGAGVLLGRFFLLHQ